MVLPDLPGLHQLFSKRRILLPNIDICYLFALLKILLQLLETYSHIHFGVIDIKKETTISQHYLFILWQILFLFLFVKISHFANKFTDWLVFDTGFKRIGLHPVFRSTISIYQNQVKLPIIITLSYTAIDLSPTLMSSTHKQLVLSFKIKPFKIEISVQIFNGQTLRKQ